MRGTRVPGFPPIRTAAAKLAIALVACSVFFALTQRGLGGALLLNPGSVLHAYSLWQPFSYVFIETSPLGVIFGALILFSIGGSLEQTWGARRLVSFALGVTVLAALLTLGLSLGVSAMENDHHAGGTVMTSALWVAYGLSFGKRQTSFWGLPLTGNMLALVGVGLVFLSGAFGSWLAIVPSAFGLLLTWLYLRVGGVRLLGLRFSSWRLQRQLKARSKHLRVITDDQVNTSRDSDRFLH